MSSFLDGIKDKLGSNNQEAPGAPPPPPPPPGAYGAPAYAYAPPPPNPTDMLMKEIEGMEFKKQTLLNSLESEVYELQQQRNNVLTQIGGIMYDAHKDKKDTDKKTVSDLYDQINQLDTTVEEKRKKKTDIADRYDEEIGLLRNSLNKPPPPPPPVPSQQDNTVAPANTASCSNCGAQYGIGDSTFCENCGTKL